MNNNPFPITAPWWFSTYLIQKYLESAVPYVKGVVLDIGCGEKKYAHLFKTDSYVGLDMNGECRVDIVGKGEILPFHNEAFDSILSTQVLEHIADLDKFLAEVLRVLKPGGYYVVTVPFIGHLHCIPNDFLRFSEFGISNLFKKHGLSMVMIRPMGGFFTTVCYLWCFLLYESIQRIKNNVIRNICHKFLGVFLLFFNPFSCIVHRLDKEPLMPFNYLAVAVKQKNV